MRKVMKKVDLLILLMLFVLFNENKAAIIQANSGSFSDVSTAVESANNGDIILLPTCSVSWNEGLSITTKGLTIIGAGIDKTIITWAGGAETVISYTPDTPARNYAFRISGCTIDLNSVEGAIAIKVNNPGTSTFITNIRIDNNKIINAAGNSGYALLTYGSIYGLIDNNIIENNLRTFRFLGADSYSWNDPMQVGTENSLFIEDNTIATNGGILFTVSWGGRIVFRYNTVDLSNRDFNITSIHGNSGVRGAVGAEIYENSFANVSDRSDGCRGIDIWSGTTIAFNNTCSGEETSFGIRYYDSDSLDNVNNTYVWNNTYNGTECKISDDGNGYIMEDTSWWDDYPNASDNNFISGLSENRSETAADNDCYWETDTRKLYRSIGTNNWTLVYEPYEYPHPMQLQPPQKLSIVGN